MAEDVWYYEKDGQQYGPVSQAELQRLIETGFISRHNLAWRPGEKDWSASGTFHDLAAAFKTPPPVKKPPAQERPSAPPPPPPPKDETPQSGGAPEDQRPGTPDVPKGPQRAPWSQRLGPAANLLWTFLKQIYDWYVGHPVRQGTTLGTLILAVIYLIFGPWPPHNPKPKEPAAPAYVSTLAGTRVPVGYTGPVGQIKIDAYPWAQVTRFSSGEKGDLAIPGGQSTPLVLLVAPGSYRIEFDGGKERCDVVVAEEQSRTCQRIIRTVDSAIYYQEIGW